MGRVYQTDVCGDVFVLDVEAVRPPVIIRKAEEKV